MSYSIVIPSANAENLVPCVHAVMQCEPDLAPEKIIVIDDGSRVNAEGRLPDVTWITGVKPFVFSRNCNLGIIFAPACDDVILLNDDALLKTAGGLSAMAEASEGWGVVSASNNCGSACQVAQRCAGVREEKSMCPAFICIYIPRATFREVGLLDERFTAYGHEDNDYVKRTRDAGLKVGIFDNCFVDHRSLRSTFRGAPGTAGDIAPGRAIYQAKWGKDAE